MALRLRRRGLARARPLAGGFDAWKRRGYPVEARRVEPGRTADL